MIPVLTVFVILVLGYARIKQDRGDFATFRRTAGWESYAYLARNFTINFRANTWYYIVACFLSTIANH